MNVFELTRALVDMESITDNEYETGAFVLRHLSEAAARYGGQAESQNVSTNRFNVYAHWGEPLVTFSTHMDTVPPFFPSREDDEFIWGRGSCDAKGIMASMITAVEELLAEGVRNIAVLFVVGEERNSAGAYHAARNPHGSQYLINGEPTENRLALGSKGALRYEITATGRMARSAYPELGESAIEKLLEVLAEIRRIPMPSDRVLGSSTVNIGTLNGGRAPNVIPDHAKAEVMFRLVDDGESIKAGVRHAVQGRAEAVEVLHTPAVLLDALDDFETCIVKYTTDIPAFGGAWGRPLLLGPGTIHVAHTSEERVPKRELLEAVEIYKKMARQLLKQQTTIG
jgi:acetylornithine deacetylase